LNTAQRLIASSEEEDWRTAAGRAYYALMLECREALLNWGFGVPARDSLHAVVRLRFSYAPDSDAERIWYVVEQLGRLRNFADYELPTSPSFGDSSKAHRAILDAMAMIALLDKMVADPIRSASISAAIRAAFP